MTEEHSTPPAVSVPPSADATPAPPVDATHWSRKSMAEQRFGSPDRARGIQGRSASALLSWMNAQDSAWRSGIATAALDPYRGYASALRSALPDAVRVLDAFHVVRLGFAAVDDVRRRIQQEQTGHRGRTGDPLYGIRRLLRRRYDHHSDKSWAGLLATP